MEWKERLPTVSTAYTFWSSTPKDNLGSCSRAVNTCHLIVDIKEQGHLQARFGNEQRIATACMEKALGWSPVKSEDVKALQAFALFLRVCCNAMEDVSYMSEMNMPSNMRAIILKLPYKMRAKWRNIAYELQEKHRRQAGFSDIVNFIERQVSIASNPLFGNIQDTSI